MKWHYFLLRFGVKEMGGPEDQFRDIDRDIATNVRTYREAARISQDELAQRMTGRGFGFSQATVWKIESGHRPVRASELIGLADSLEVHPSIALAWEPETTRHKVGLERANAAALAAYNAVKAAAAAYLEAQVDLMFTAHEAHDSGFVVTETYTSWLTIPPEEAVFIARAKARNEAGQVDKVTDEVDKIIKALRSSGYEPNLRIEDISKHGGGSAFPIWTPDWEEHSA